MYIRISLTPTQTYHRGKPTIVADFVGRCCAIACQSVPKVLSSWGKLFISATLQYADTPLALIEVALPNRFGGSAALCGVAPTCSENSKVATSGFDFGGGTGSGRSDGGAKLSNKSASLELVLEVWLRYGSAGYPGGGLLFAPSCVSGKRIRIQLRVVTGLSVAVGSAMIQVGFSQNEVAIPEGLLVVYVCPRWRRSVPLLPLGKHR